jgi:predicted RNA-binding Zn-ribbon protein involved in translation (DUF1610 family)
MPESKIEVVTKTFKASYKCDDCGNEVTRSSNVVLTTYPAKYEHACTMCGKVYYLTKVYPTLVTEVIENQCDGCRQGLPLDNVGNHFNPDKTFLIGCTKNNYL